MKFRRSGKPGTPRSVEQKTGPSAAPGGGSHSSSGNGQEPASDKKGGRDTKRFNLMEMKFRKFSNLKTVLLLLVMSCTLAGLAAQTGPGANGRFYCTSTGMVIPGGSVTVTPEDGNTSGSVTVVSDGSDDGFYQFTVADITSSVSYTVTATLPPGFDLDATAAATQGFTATTENQTVGAADEDGDGTLDRDTDTGTEAFAQSYTFTFSSAQDGSIQLANIPITGCPIEVQVDARASCTNPETGQQAPENQYFVIVEAITSTDPGPYDVTVAGMAEVYTPGTTGDLVFGPFDHSMSGGGQTDENVVQTVEAVSQNDPNATGTGEPVEVLCGILTDNGLNASGPFCMVTDDADKNTGGILAYSAPGSFQAGGNSGQVQLYILTRDSVIVESNFTGLFMNLPSDTFDVFAVNFREGEQPDVTQFINPGQDIRDLINGETATDPTANPLAGACFTVCVAPQVIVNCMSIGSTVFTDNDDDALFETADGETGIPNVTVEIYGKDSVVGVNMPLLTTMTDADGNYFFGGLDSGSYVISIPTAPDGFPLSSTNGPDIGDTQTDNDDNGRQDGAGARVTSDSILLQPQLEIAEAGANAGAGQDDNVSFSTGQSDDELNGDMTVDFGFAPPLSIGSTVFYDVDNSGAQDTLSTLEQGIADVLVLLYKDTSSTLGVPIFALVDSVRTDDMGNYLFDSLSSGDYQVAITTPLDAVTPSSGPASVQQTGSTDDNTDGNSDGLTTSPLDGALVPTAGDTILSGTLTLTPGEEPTGGNEKFPGGKQDEDDDANGNMTVDFGLIPDLSIGSTVFFDLNDDGMQMGTNEVGIPGVEVVLFRDFDGDGVAETPVDTTLTDNMGDYFFGMLPMGDYQVVIPTPNASAPASSTPPDTGTPNVLADATDVDGDDNGDQPGGPGTATSSNVFSLAPDVQPEDEPGQGGTQDIDNGGDDNDGNMTVDFGFVPQFSIGSTVFQDNDNSATQDPGEPGIPDVEVILYEDVDMSGGFSPGDTIVNKQETDDDGNYFFDMLPPADYFVAVVPPDDNPFSSDELNDVDDPEGTTADGDDNGMQDAKGDSIFTMSVTLGGDEFEPLDAVENGEQGGELDGTDNLTDSLGNMTLDIGLFPGVSLGSTVFIDANNDGTQLGPDETGISDITVLLYADADMDGTFSNGDTIVAIDTTDANGDYFFGGLAEGDYLVAVVPNADYPLSSSNGEELEPDDNGDGVDNGVVNSAGTAPVKGDTVFSGGITLSAGDEPTATGANTTATELENAQGSAQDGADDSAADANGNMTIDFGFYPGVSIGSTVFLDNDNNAIQDLDEPGIAMVPVILLDANGVPVDTAITDPAGNYFFGGLEPGTYEVIIPASAFDPNGAFNGPLVDANLSSEDPQFEGDNQMDGNDNGMQPAGAGSVVSSGPIELMIGDEPTDGGADPENGQGNLADDLADANGDMTVDFGFVPTMFDLALFKELGEDQAMLVAPGDTVTFSITVVNQGNVAADNIVVTDSLPDGLTFLPDMNPGWIINGTKFDTTITTFNGLDSLVPDSSVMVDIMVRVDVPQDAEMVLTNFSEISGATNGFDMIIEDIDSDPDDDLGNDEFLVDNEINGNGKEGGDEDDHDIASVTTVAFDLALRKVLTDPSVTTFAPGDTVSFDIQVFNQGMIPADSIVIRDSFPNALTLVADEAFVAGAAGAEFSIATDTLVLGGSGLAPMDSTAVTVRFVLSGPLAAGTELRNFADIRMAQDTAGNEQQDADSDYTDNDDTEDGDDDDTDGDGNNGGDEDESDFAAITTAEFDLALRKVLSDGQASMVAPGDTVSFDVIVFNQGQIVADSIVINDFIPTGMTFDDTNTEFAVDAAGTIATDTLVGPLAVNASDTVKITLVVIAPQEAGMSLRNVAEIVSAKDTTGGDQSDFDIDSDYDDDGTPDDIADTDDDEIDEQGVDADGNPTGTDEDESDFAEVVLQGFDLALIKVLSEGQASTVNPGDTVNYDIIVINQGMIPADSIVIRDFIPDGMTLPDNSTFVLDGTSAVDTFAVADGDIAAGGILPGTSDTFAIRLVLDNPLAGGLSLRNIAEIQSATDDNGNPQDDADSEYTDGTQPDDIDDSDDNETEGNGTNAGDEDESDFADVTTNTFDLALQKKLSAGQPTGVRPGDTVSYDLIVINQGDIAADSVCIADLIPADMTFDATGNIADWTLAGDTAQVKLSVAAGTLPADGLVTGASDTVVLRLVLTAPSPGATSVRNFAEIQSARDTAGNMVMDEDSDFNVPGEPLDDIDDNDDDSTLDNGQQGGDEDESDFEDIDILRFDIALQKFLSEGQDRLVGAGDTVRYDLVITNQGDIPADSIVIRDFLPAGMTLDSESRFSADGATAVDTLVAGDGTLAPGGLAPKTKDTVQISLVVDDPIAGGLTLRNVAEIESATDENGNPVDDIDSEYFDGTTPDDIADSDNDEINDDGLNNGGDEDESDFESVMTRSFDLAITKTLGEGQSANVEVGDTVLFNIRVFNQGNIPADSIRVSDYAPTREDGFLYSAELNPGWGEPYAEINDTTYLDTLLTDFNGMDLLRPDTFIDVSIRLIVNPAMEVIASLDNLAEISDARGPNGTTVSDGDSPMDTIPGNDSFQSDNDINGNGLTGGDEDNSDPATIQIGGFDLALVKRIAQGQSRVVSPGENVSFEITIINQGAIAADSVEIIDYLPEGFVFDTALNAEWVATTDSTATTVLTRGNGLPVDGLESGQRASATIVLTVAPPMFPDYALGQVGPDSVNMEGVISGQQLTNEAEIVSATDTTGRPVADIDSDGDDEQGNDGDIDDDNENGTGEDGDDEDDSDIAVVEVRCYQDPGVNRTVEVCLGCDEAVATINLFESLGGRPNVGGTFFADPDLFRDENGEPVTIDISDPENVLIPGSLDRDEDYFITYSIPDTNGCGVRTSMVTIDIIDIQNLACTGFQNISLGEECEAVITPSMILQGDMRCVNTLSVTLMTADGRPFLNAAGQPTDTVGNAQIGQTLLVSLVDTMCNNSCWGEILIEDKQAPIIEVCPADIDGFMGVDFICNDLDSILNNPSSLNITGSPVVSDNCTPTEDLRVEFFDRLLNGSDNCGEKRILRRFMVTDASNNSAFCFQEITVRQPTLADLNFDRDTAVIIDCNDDFAMLENGNPVAAGRGLPTLRTVFDSTALVGGETYCNMAVTFEDSRRIETCDNNYKIIRTFRIFDWCNPDRDTVYNRVIKVGDFEAPELVTAGTNTLAADTLTFGTNGGNVCGAFIRLDQRFDVIETCSNDVFISVNIYPFGDTTANPMGTYNITLGGEPDLSDLVPVGTHLARYVLRDNCGNARTQELRFTVEDRTNPIAICEDGLNISLANVGGQSGVAVLTPDMIDKGSKDDCSPTLSYLIARLGDNELPIDEEVGFDGYRETLRLTCADIGTVRVGLRVFDTGNFTGNPNDCWLDVLVEDKIAPACVVPENVTIDCQDFNGQFSSDPSNMIDSLGQSAALDAVFGQAAGVDNCTNSIVQTIVGEVNNCGVGQFVRTFTITDVAGNSIGGTSCQQTITVQGVYDYRVTFPVDIEVTDCGATPDMPVVTAEEFGCDLIAIDSEVDTFRTQVSGDECFKLQVEWEIINWCEFDGNADPYIISRTAAGRISEGFNRNELNTPLYLNVIPGRSATMADDTAFLTIFTDRTFDVGAPLTNGAATASTQFDELLDDGPAGDQNTIFYGGDASRGYFRYVQFIKVYDRVDPVITVSVPEDCFGGEGANCAANFDLTFIAEDACSDVTVDIEIDVDYVVTDGFAGGTAFGGLVTNDDSLFTVSLTAIPVGEHALRIRVDDGCGNTDVAILPFCVDADKAPTPICIQTLTVNLMPDGRGGAMADIWANDFIASRVVDCFGDSIDKFAIYQIDEIAAGFNGPDAADIGTTLDCQDFLNGPTDVRVYAIDNQGNSDFCSVVVDVTDNLGLCDDDGSASLAGVIATEAMVPVENVTVRLTGQDEQLENMETDADGAFSFINLAPGVDYTITPSHYLDYLNGVRTSDIVGITRHILGMSLLDSPYKMLAADVDGNEDIDIVDIVAIRRLILGLTDGFPNDRPSWNFVAADHDFTDLDNPWGTAFPEVLNYNNLEQRVFTADFVGVKLGDVNGSAVANLLTPAKPRSIRGDFELEIDELDLRRGETYRVPVRASQLDEVDGYQFTLTFDKTAVDILEIEGGLVTDAHFGWRFAEQGLITTSWNWAGSSVPADWTGDEVLFTIVLRAEAAESLSNTLTAGSRWATAEAYERDNEQHRTLSLSFLDNFEVVGTYRLLQNIPNPVRRETTIGYELPRYEPEVTISLTDASGRLIREYRMEGHVGLNTLAVSKRDLANGSGVFSYTVTAGDWTATKRMVVME